MAKITQIKWAKPKKISGVKLGHFTMKKVPSVKGSKSWEHIPKIAVKEPKLGKLK